MEGETRGTKHLHGMQMEGKTKEFRMNLDKIEVFFP